MGKDTQTSTDVVVVSVKTWDQFKRDSEWLQCLEEAGVDNWNGIEHAFEIAEEKGIEV